MLNSFFKKNLLALIVLISFFLILGILVETTFFMTRFPGWIDDFYLVRPSFFNIGFLAFIPGFYNPTEWMGHSPLLPFLLNGINILFDDIVRVNRVFSYISFIFLILYTLKLSLQNKLPLMLPIFILLLSSLSEHIYVVIASGNADMILLAFGYLGLFCFFEKKYLAGSILLGLTVLVRESGLAFAIGALFFIDLNLVKRNPRNLLYYLFPFVVLGEHFLLTYFTEGTWLTHPYATGNLGHFEGGFFSLVGIQESLAQFGAVASLDFAPTIWLFLVVLAFLGFIFFRGGTLRLALGVSVVASLFFVFFIFYKDHVQRDFASTVFGLLFLVALTFSEIMQRIPKTSYGVAPFCVVLSFIFIPLKFSEAVDFPHNVWFPDEQRIKLYQQAGQTISSIPESYIVLDSNEILMWKFDFPQFKYSTRRIFSASDNPDEPVNVAVIFSPTRAKVINKPDLEKEIIKSGFILLKEIAVGSHWARVYYLGDNGFVGGVREKMAR